MIFFSTAHRGGNDFATFFNDIAIDSAKKYGAVCQLLDIKPGTLARYLSGKSCPPAAMVRLLFHECSYGRSATDSHAHAGFLYERQLAAARLVQLENMRLTVEALEAENNALKLAGAGLRDVAANGPRYK